MNKRMTLSILGTGIAVASVLAIGIPRAMAADYPELAAQSGTGYALNDWNGSGSGAVKMYDQGVTNDNYEVIQLTGYCSDGNVSASPACPFVVGTGWNGALAGGEIFEIYSPVSGKCIGTDTSGNADMGPCPPSDGKGVGSNIWVAAQDSSCNSGPNGSYFENVYWINKIGGNWGDGDGESLLSGGAIGNQAIITGFFEGSCWGEVNS